VPHHLLDLLDPGEPFHAAAWAGHARKAIEDIGKRGRLVIVTGGTGLYYRALVQGLFEAPPADPAIRARHQAEAAEHGPDALHARLRHIDPEAAVRIRPGDLVRISRALEIYEQTGIPLTVLHHRARRPTPLRVYAVVLDPALDDLRDRIARRVDGMMNAGFVTEVQALRAAGFGQSRAVRDAIGYGPIGRHLDSALTLDAAVAETKRVTVAYARRQRTWFRREESEARAATPPDPDALSAAITRWRQSHATAAEH
jgi:tRNA dimethylallyltransferase